MLSRIFLLAFAVCLLCDVSVQGQSELWLHVTDGRKQDVRDVQLSERESTNWSAPTSDRGLTKLDLEASVKPGAIIYLELHKPPNMKIALPLESRVVVPNSTGPEVVRVLRRRERIILAVPEMIGAVAHAILQSSLPDSVEIGIDNQGVSVKLRQAGLEAIAADLELSSSDIDQAIRNLPQSSTEPFLKAVGLLYAGDYAAAIEQLNKAKINPPHDPHEQLWATSDSNFLLGQAYLEQGQFLKSLQAFGEAATFESHNPRVLKAYALSLYKGQRFADALGVWGKLLKMMPKNKFIYLNQGFTLDKMERNPDAIRSFEQYLNLETAVVPAGQVYDRVGDLYLKAGNSEMALQSYRSALKFLRQDSDMAWQTDTFSRMKQLYARDPNPRVAVAYNEELLLTTRQANDKKAEFQVLGALAQAYEQQGNSQKALESYTAALKIADETSAVTTAGNKSNKLISDTETVQLLRSFSIFLQKTNAPAEAQKMDSRAQRIMGVTGKPN